ncbi:hypothetical protein PHYBOEH_011719 [Phytophthora boehmeriae]|uniref:CH-like domain-containing protein n=1 Tax=Phytophthora boehmeriae TaxID=109152 RepID=A0A8T1WWV7_9STRA|nr:hypothetical protein PHYBOEH_011719 [Phytophthora boehmeriae]
MNAPQPAETSSPSHSSDRSSDNQTEGVTSDGVGFYTSDKWAKFYPNQEVAVVTSIGPPSVPPEEVLHLKGLEPQFESYEDASSMAAKIRNMELLEQRFEALGMPFPMSTRRAIMMEDRSVVLQFLLQLKDFLRRPKTKVDDGKPKMNAREKPVKARVAAESKVPPRDVEERFVATTMKKFHPTEIRFDKGFDMAVHLRKFQQAQWTAENKLSDLRQQDAHAKDGESAAGYTAARAHLKDKAQFMRDWDQEHREKWKETQRTFLATERSNLRLELTLQARQQINADVRLAESQHDGTAGVVDFERNMNRLGLTFEAAEQSLRAIPANDPGPRVHLRGLELRVEDLDFRPSNNIKMMKELRKRRKAQLAAEKDRRMRRQKALALQKMVTSSRVSIERHDDHEIKDIQHPELDNQVSVSAENADTIEVEGIGDVELADDAHESDNDVVDMEALQKEIFIGAVPSQSAMSEQDDESGVELVRRVSVEHHLAFLQLDQVVDGCVQTNSDQQKLGDPAALSDRERELGAFGVKISSLRQKNAVLPDALIIEIIAKTISLFRREASALSSESGTLSSTGGCILHNFPRTVDEAKLLEKAILADIPAEESEPSKESPALEDDSETPEELATPAVVSAWDCVISISADQDLLGHAPEADNPLQASDSAPVLVNNPSSAKLLPAEAQRKLDEEQKARNDEQRACLEDYWGQTTRHVRLNRTGLHGDVVVEAIHLCIDVFTQNPHKGVPAVIECGDGVFPEQLKAQRDKRREAMNLVDRVLWMRASEEIDIADDAITKLQGILHKMDEALSLKIREPMAMIRSVVHAISALAVMAEQGLESELQNGGATSFQVLVDQATTKLKFAASLSFQERILTELEVSLGDLVDSNRVAGNDFVAVLAQDPLPQVIGAVDVIYQSLPLICSVLTEHTMEKLEVVREQLYDFVPFLKEDMRDTGREVVLLKVLPREAMNATMELGGDRAGGGAPAQIAGAEVLAILGQVASKYSFHLVDELPDQQYAMNEANVTTQEITQLLQRITMVCRFADQLKQTTGQLYANDVKRLERAVQEDHQSKDKILVQTLGDI